MRAWHGTPRTKWYIARSCMHARVDGYPRCDSMPFEGLKRRTRHEAVACPARGDTDGSFGCAHAECNGDLVRERSWAESSTAAYMQQLPMAMYRIRDTYIHPMHPHAMLRRAFALSFCSGQFGLRASPRAGAASLWRGSQLRLMSDCFILFFVYIRC